MQTAFVWDKSYARQRTAQVYKGEYTRLKDAYTDLARIADADSRRKELIKRFFGERKRSLDPPEALMYSLLSHFLSSIQSNSAHTSCVLLDERHDPTGGNSSTRLWDSEKKAKDGHGYMDFPPIGDILFKKRFDLAEFKDSMVQQVSSQGRV